MSLLAIVLVIVSAVMHAAWNVLSKSRVPSASFFLIACLLGVLLLSPSFILYFDTATQFPLPIWGLLLITGLFQAIYYTALAGAYRNGDISVVYPISRSAPVIVVSVVTLILGRGHQVSEICIFGIFVVVAGCFLIPLQRYTDFHLKNYLNVTCCLALTAAIGVAGYSIIDDEALRRLRMDGNITLGDTELTILYFFFEALSASFFLFLFVVVRADGRSDLIQVCRKNIRNAIIAGIGIHLTYLIVLISMAFVDNVTYVVGLRQLSIPLGAIFGILLLKEKPYPPKIFGVVIMSMGLMMIAAG